MLKAHYILQYFLLFDKWLAVFFSAILQKIKADNPTKTVVLNIEPIVPDAKNIEERKKRLAFYQKNGFFDTGYFVREVGGVFTVMATEKNIDVAAYQEIFKALTFGVWKVKIKKELF